MSDLAPVKEENEQGKDNSTQYIAHLDGLRAIALICVLLFHFEIDMFKKGFLGVDIFFSISGFIITRSIEERKRNGCFGLKEFYLRRYFRLYPASALVIFLSVIASHIFLPFEQAKETCRSALASLLMSSNIFFHSFQDYFSTDAKLKPLLHTWSLSLEEQFYFIWAPLLLLPWFSASSKRNCKLALFITMSLSAISFLLSVSLENHKISFVFYEIPCRIFQFAIGSSAYFFARLNHFNTSSINQEQVLSTRNITYKTNWSLCQI